MNISGKVWCWSAVFGGVVAVGLGLLTDWIFARWWYGLFFFLGTVTGVSAWGQAQVDQAIIDMNERDKARDKSQE